jgi:hypothetical protein
MNEPGIPAPLYVSTSAPPPPGSLTFGQILDRIFRLMRSNFRLFVGIAAAPATAILALYAVMIATFLSILRLPYAHRPPQLPPMMGWMFFAIFLFDLLLIVIYALYEPAASYAALQANAGVKATIGEAWAVAWHKAGRYIWLAILRSLIVALPIMVLAGLIGGTVAYSFVHAKANGDPWVFVSVFPFLMLLYLGAIVYAVLVMLRIVLAVPACVAENVSAWAAIRRSNQLTCGARGRIFLLGLLLYAFAYVAMMLLELVVFFFVAIGMLVAGLAHITMVPWGLVGIGVLAVIVLCAFFVFTACISAVCSTAIVVVYHDQRLRKESSTPAHGA